MVVEGKVTALFDSFPNEFSTDFKRTAETRFSQAAQIAFNESENDFKRAWQWVKDIFRGSKYKILELAKKIEMRGSSLVLA